MKKTVLLSAAAVLLVVVVAFAANRPKQSRITEKTVKTIEMNKKMFVEKVFDYENNSDEWKYIGDKPAIIDFWAPWCGPCKQISPILEELAKQYDGEIYIYKINVDNEPELANTFGIRSIPTLLFVPMEGKPHMAQGALPKESFKKVIDEVLLNKKQ